MRARLPWLWLFVVCATAFTWTNSGRITFPDDEIVFQTTASLAERGSLGIDGIPFRSGEPANRPDGTFGWALGVDGQTRYGIFGHGLSIAALPAYAFGKATASRVPPEWTRAIRGDLQAFHSRSVEADWLRICVSFTNTWISALGSVLLGLWLASLGASRTASMSCALAYALGTSAWAYTSTFLSEPLSATVLLGAAYAIDRGREGGPGARALAGMLAGFAIHVHVLNLLALPILALYALGPNPRLEWRQWVPCFAFAVLGTLVLAIDHSWRFGNPFETGRYDHYGQWVAPWEGLVAQIVAPGRSVWLYSPALVVAALGWPALRRHHRRVAWLCLAMVLARYAFVSARSDWYGGWGLGPRYLVAVLPFAIVPLFMVVDRLRCGPRPARLALALALSACGVVGAYYAVHSIFQWMWHLDHLHPDGWKDLSHWSLGATPIVGFAELERPALGALLDGDLAGVRARAQLDTLSFGAWRLAAVGHAGLWRLFVGLGLVGLAAGAALARASWLDRHELGGCQRAPSSE